MNAESWGRVVVDSPDPIRRTMAIAVIEAAERHDRSRREEFLVQMFGAKE